MCHLYIHYLWYDRFIYFDWPCVSTAERIELPMLDAFSVLLCCEVRQMAHRRVPCWRYTCAFVWSSFLIWTPHSLPINPRIPPATSMTSRRIATYRAAPFRAPFHLYAKGSALFNSHLNLPRIRLKNHSMIVFTDPYIDYCSNLIDFLDLYEMCK